jgi:Protein of unknown function (DUF551)
MMEWIKDIRVLCCGLDNSIDIIEYWHNDEKTGKPVFYNPPSPSCCSISHWMPLPEPSHE